jgi:ferredoxin
MMLPAPVAHSLDDVCHGGECATCTQNIQIATLAELRELNALLRPFAQMAQTRMGLLRGFTRGT